MANNIISHAPTGTTAKAIESLIDGQIMKVNVSLLSIFNLIFVEKRCNSCKDVHEDSDCFNTNPNISRQSWRECLKICRGKGKTKQKLSIVFIMKLSYTVFQLLRNPRTTCMPLKRLLTPFYFVDVSWASDLVMAPWTV